MHRDRNETRGRVKTFTRRKAAENGWRKRREERETENALAAFICDASNTLPASIHTQKAAAPTPTARSLRVSNLNEGRPRRRVGKRRERKRGGERGREAGRERQRQRERVREREEKKK